MRSWFSRLVLAAALLSSATGHTGGCCGSGEVRGPDTEAECPQASTLTYANFGESFMSRFCTRCHSSTLTGEARMGATAFHDFDTLEGIKRVGDHIDQTAGSGPAATNESMPPNGAKPTLEERRQLSEWMACGAP